MEINDNDKEINSAWHVHEEIGVKNPICVFEENSSREDISMSEALTIIRKRSLKPVKHPRLGISSC